MTDKKLKIYIVDDDETVIRLMTLLLERAGHYVESRLAGVSALPWIFKMKPDLVISDMMMAEMDGLELTGIISREPKLAKTKVILCSGRDEKMWTDKAKEAGAVGYIPKPFNPSTFAADIERYAGVFSD